MKINVLWPELYIIIQHQVKEIIWYCFFFKFGRWDLKTIAEKGGEWPDNINKYTAQMFQVMHDSPKFFKGAKDYVLLVDLEGYDNRQFTSYQGEIPFLISETSYLSSFHFPDLKFSDFSYLLFMYTYVFK